ncbi:MAG: right-handed parallel beta-helix repeat-containing protein [archaeon]|nr:right-handed parallel beta-helix repeat-containing protein [archaeon]
MDTKKAGGKIGNDPKAEQTLTSKKELPIIAAIILGVALIGAMAVFANFDGSQATGLAILPDIDEVQQKTEQELEENLNIETQGELQETEEPAEQPTFRETEDENAQKQNTQQEDTGSEPKVDDSAQKIMDPKENNAPEILSFAPQNLEKIKEGETIEFSVEATDADGDNLEYTWFVDRKIRGTKEKIYTFKAGYSSAGQTNIEVIISDGQNETKKTWTVLIKSNICQLEIEDGKPIDKDLVLCPEKYTLPSGLDINASNIRIDCRGAIIDGNRSGENGIKIHGVNNVRIENCNISKYRTGLNIENSSGTFISKNTISTNQTGINIKNASELTIQNNEITQNNINGIQAQDINTTTIQRNTISTNFDNGLYLMGSNNTITRNTIADNLKVGIYLYYGSENTITYNTFRSNGEAFRVNTIENKASPNYMK